MKNNKILIATFALLTLVSCKKDYVCECTETYTESVNGVVDNTETDSYKTTYKEVTKKWVKNTAACTSNETELTQTMQGDTYVMKSVTDCTLSK